MKGVIIGTDLLQDNNGDVKVLEINSNVGIYQDSNEYFDFDGFVTLLLDNSINELHFIFDSNEVNIQNTPNYGPDESVRELTFLSRLKRKSEENNITFYEYEVMSNSITVPFIEDAPNKFILRQAYDSTALIDSEYCSDKFKFQDLISESGIDIDSYTNSTEIEINTLTDVEIGDHPNLLVKYRYPGYDTKSYPQIYVAPNEEVLTNLKTNLSPDYILQKYVYSDNNVVDNRYTVIRSMDIFYGPNLDVFHLGSCTVSAAVEKNVWEDEIEEVSTGLVNNKTRVKYINGRVSDNNEVIYHVDQDTKIVDSNGNLISIDDINVGTTLKSITINGLDGEIPPSQFFSTVNHLSTNINFVDTNVVEMKSQPYEGLFIKITLEDGTVWSDIHKTNLYVELSGTTDTVFRRVNMLSVGDKILSVNKVTNEVIAIPITNLEVTYESKTIYEIDVEESDLFLTSIGDDNSVLKLAIQHNPCYACYGWNCGNWSCSGYCPGCGCFAEGTEIVTPSGIKKIEDFKENDYVKSLDIQNNELVNKKSYKLSSFDYNGSLVIINGIRTMATIGHPFAVKDNEGNLKWAAYDKEEDKTYFDDGLVVFNLLDEEFSINLNGEWVKIENVELEPYDGKVYNISVEDTHNYIANNILVHNVEKKIN
jgi:intein/homing endonuclease